MVKMAMYSVLYKFPLTSVFYETCVTFWNQLIKKDDGQTDRDGFEKIPMLKQPAYKWPWCFITDVSLNFSFLWFFKMLSMVRNLYL